MQKHTKVYYDHFRLTEGDTVLCELCGKVAVDINHIYPRGMGGRKTFTHNGRTYDINHINNLIALDRNCHNEYEARRIDRGYLWIAHQMKLRK